MEKSIKKVVGIGELLWDVLPSGKQLGGAPCNFAYHAGQIGCDPYVVSAIGNDIDGTEIIENIKDLALDHKFIQKTEIFPTGTVTVSLDEKGIPDYTIHENVAWDNISWNNSLEKLAKEANAVCFGSLAQRNEVSQKTILKFLENTKTNCLRVFDINLRQSFYNKEIINKSLQFANILKLNDEELPIVARTLGYEQNLDSLLKVLMNDFQLQLIAYTKGSNGSLLITPDEESYCEVPKVKVTDTVGAGDSFTGVFISGLLQNIELKEIHKRATEVAAYVCTQKGATPKIPIDMQQFKK